MTKEAITEEMGVHKQWYEEAKKVQLSDLPAFIDHLLNDYQHDYGTICHALAAGAIATLWAMNTSPQGGVTGFQAGAIMWEFIGHWNHEGNKTSMKLLDYDNFLYPQYAYKFEKTITPRVWAAIQQEAKTQLEEADKLRAQYIKDKEQYDLDLARFIEKHPDYRERPDYYNRLNVWTSAQWEAEKQKEKGGFEFAPRAPYLPIHPEVYDHWVSIVDGKVPFGYSVKTD